MNLRKKRINKLSCLNWIEQGQKVVIALYDAMRFKEKLLDLGFSSDFLEGEAILPSVINASTKRNAEKFLSDLPGKVRRASINHTTLFAFRSRIFKSQRHL